MGKEGRLVCRRRFVNAGACRAILHAMHTFLDDRNLQCEGCRALVQLLECGIAATNDLVSPIMTTKTVLATMQTFPADQDALYYGSWAILMLARRGTETCSGLLEAGVCEVLLAAMRALPQD